MTPTLEPGSTSTMGSSKVLCPLPSPMSNTNAGCEGNAKAIAEMKELERKQRKAQNQRRYYHRLKVKPYQRTARSRPFTCESRDSSSQDEDGVGEQSAHAFSLVPVNLEVPLIGSGCRSPPSEPLSFDHPSSSPVDPIRSNAQHEINILHDEEHGVFDKHDLHGRLAFIHQLIASMEAKWGSLPRWPVKFTRDWPDVKGQGKEVVHNWFGEVRELLRNAWRAIAYLSRLLDGVSPLSIDECRIVFLEMQRLNCDLHLGVLGLELRLDLVVEQYRFINLSL